MKIKISHMTSPYHAKRYRSLQQTNPLFKSSKSIHSRMLKKESISFPIILIKKTPILEMGCMIQIKLSTQLLTIYPCNSSLISTLKEMDCKGSPKRKHKSKLLNLKLRIKLSHRILSLRQTFQNLYPKNKNLQ